MAVEDFGGEVLGKKIQVFFGDHKHKVDVAADLAERWFTEDHVGAIVDMPNSTVALAIQKLAAERDKSRNGFGRQQRSHRQRLHANRFPLGVRHLFKHCRHGTSIGRIWPQHLVFYHSRLRVRVVYGGKCQRRRESGRW